MTFDVVSVDQVNERTCGIDQGNQDHGTTTSNHVGDGSPHEDREDGRKKGAEQQKEPPCRRFLKRKKERERESRWMAINKLLTYL